MPGKRSDVSALPVELQADPRLKRIEALGYYLDSAIRLPGIGYRIGYDALLGLIPGVGDVVGLALSVYILIEAARFRLPASTLLRMALNVALEVLVGAVPLLGDLFDATWKANARNLALLHDRLAARQAGRKTSDRGFFLGVVLALLLLLVLLAAAVFYLVQGMLALLGV